MEVNKVKKATLAGGCFWCMVKPFAQISGIKNVVAGYTGGTTSHPTYEEVCCGKTGHYEAVELTYDETQVDYRDILNIFWQQIDPADAGGQFADRGQSYQTAIFYHDEEQKLIAEKSKQDLATSGKFTSPIATAILPAVEFYPAEGYHQNYYQTNPEHYERYFEGSGRMAFQKKHWGDFKDNPTQLQERLTPLQYAVTQQDQTEPPFQNEFWDNHQEGIYVDIISGEPLFTSQDKFDSGCGWPSFTRPINDSSLIEKTDLTHQMIRTEVRSRIAESHLGHVFPDGPPAQGGLRYCINSAALRFIPREAMEQEGYGEYLHLLK